MLLGVALAAVPACGDSGDASPSTDSAPTSMCPEIETSPEDTAWLLQYCEAFEVPGRIVALELLPAVSGANAEPPEGDGWDWDEVQAACTRIADALPRLNEVLRAAPPRFDQRIAATSAYVSVLSDFAERCVPAASDRDYEEMRTLVPLLDDAADLANEAAVALVESRTTPRVRRGRPVPSVALDIAMKRLSSTCRSPSLIRNATAEPVPGTIATRSSEFGPGTASCERAQGSSRRSANHSSMRA